MRVLLFDVDGTLLTVHSGSRTAVEHAVTTVTGQTISTEGISFSGRTDPDIFRAVLTQNGVPPTDSLLATITREYLRTARRTIKPKNVEPLPGVPGLLSLLANRKEVVLALVTGNVEAIAVHKLKSAGLASYFSVGGYGSDHVNRAKLPQVAVRRASTMVGQAVSIKDAVVIGDTERDIKCARTSGASSVAVCTGRYTSSDLIPHRPDLLLEDLTPPNEIAKQILSI